MRNKPGYTHIGGQLQNIRPSWSDSQLAALVSDMRKQEAQSVSQFAVLDYAKLEERCVMEEIGEVIDSFVANHGRLPYIQVIGRATRVPPNRSLVKVVDVVQGDQVFETAASDPVTVLYVHDADYFISLMVVREGNAPFIIQRHSEAVIYKVVKP